MQAPIHDQRAHLQNAIALGNFHRQPFAPGGGAQVVIHLIWLVVIAKPHGDLAPVIGVRLCALPADQVVVGIMEVQTIDVPALHLQVADVLELAQIMLQRPLCTESLEMRLWLVSLMNSRNALVCFRRNPGSM